MAPIRRGGGNGNARSERSLRQSIKNRTQTIRKKAQELSILCDIDVALVCYPAGTSGPTTWPPDRSEIEEVVRRYVDAPANKKLPKNQITLHDSSAGADKREDSGKATAEKAARLRIPFPDDEDKLRALGGILESRLAEVRKMIAVRRMEEKDKAVRLGFLAEAGPGSNWAATGAAGSSGAPNFSQPCPCYYCSAHGH